MQCIIITTVPLKITLSPERITTGFSAGYKFPSSHQ